MGASSPRGTRGSPPREVATFVSWTMTMSSSRAAPSACSGCWRAVTDRIAYGAVTMCDEALRPVSTLTATLHGDVVVPCLLGGFEVRHVALLFPRRVVDLAGPWSTGLPVSADWDFVLRALEHAEVVGTTEPAVLYRRHGASVSGRADLESGERAREEIIDRFLARNPSLEGTRVERRARAACGDRQGTRVCRDGRRVCAR